MRVLLVILASLGKLASLAFLAVLAFLGMLVFLVKLAFLAVLAFLGILVFLGMLVFLAMLAFLGMLAFLAMLSNQLIGYLLLLMGLPILAVLLVSLKEYSCHLFFIINNSFLSLSFSAFSSLFSSCSLFISSSCCLR